METPHLAEDDEDYHREITQVLMDQLELLVPNIREKKGPCGGSRQPGDHPGFPWP